MQALPAALPPARADHHRPALASRRIQLARITPIFINSSRIFLNNHAPAAADRSDVGLLGQEASAGLTVFRICRNQIDGLVRMKNLPCTGK
jgi:hypothetical protein